MPATKSKFVALGVQFKDVASTDGTIPVKDLLKVNTPYGRTAIGGLADQIHVWTGMAWQKYYYNSTITNWAKEGTTTLTDDVVKHGDTVFFIRSSRGDGVVTLAGELAPLTAKMQYSLTKSKYHFVAYPWPVSFKIKDFLGCIDKPYGRTAIGGLADQVHVWTGMNWAKYYYNTTAGGFVKEGETTITEDAIEAGQGVFFLRSSRGDGVLTFDGPAAE